MDELIGKRYGSALFELAQEKGAVEQLKAEVTTVLDALTLDGELLEILSHPKIVMDEKIKLIESIFSEKVSQDFMGLMVLVVKKGRQSSLLSILQYCLDAISELEGVVKASITSSHELDSTQKDAIEKQLAQMTGKKIHPQYNIDLSLIGGLIVRIGDRIVDNSIKGKMHTMSRELLNTKLNI